MAKAFVDTTVLTDAALKPGTEQNLLAIRALRACSSTVLPTYAIKEFKSGPLTNFVWFHNRLVEQPYALALQALQRTSLSPQRYKVSTALEALSIATARAGSLTPKDLEEKHGKGASLDEILRDRIRLDLRQIILMAWRKRRKLTTEFLGELNCYSETPPKEEASGVLDVKPVKCSTNKEHKCSLQECLSSKHGDIAKLLAVIPEDSARREDQRRRKALRSVLNADRKGFPEDVCRDLGDALFALLAPTDSFILTTNLRDHGPLAQALGKVAKMPKDVI